MWEGCGGGGEKKEGKTEQRRGRQRKSANKLSPDQSHPRGEDGSVGNPKTTSSLPPKIEGGFTRSAQFH